MFLHPSRVSSSILKVVLAPHVFGRMSLKAGAKPQLNSTVFKNLFFKKHLKSVESLAKLYIVADRLVLTSQPAPFVA
jgi:hypothetical protein